MGSREHFEELNRSVEANDIHPVMEERVYKFEEAREAYQQLWDQKVFGKLCIEID